MWWHLNSYVIIMMLRVIRTKSWKVLAKFGFAWKGWIDHIGVQQTPINIGILSDLTMLRSVNAHVQWTLVKCHMANYDNPFQYIFKYFAVLKSNYKGPWREDGMVIEDAWAPCNFKRDHSYQMSCEPVLKFWQPLKLRIAKGSHWGGFNPFSALVPTQGT